MLRRPLERPPVEYAVAMPTIGFDFMPDRPTEEFALVASIGPKVGLPPYQVYSPESLYQYGDADAVASSIGLDITPRPKMVLSQRFTGQREDTFLQLGWARDRRQVAFEVGDHSKIVSLHFRKNTIEKALPYHLDTIEIDDGSKQHGEPVTFHLPCDEDDYRPQVKSIFQSVCGVVQFMTLNDWRSAQDCFHETMAPVIRYLNDLSDVLHADHEIDMTTEAPSRYTSPRPGWHP